MKLFRNSDLIDLAEFGQYLQDTIEFCTLHHNLQTIDEIEWNIQKLSYPGEESADAFFLEVVITVTSIALDNDVANTILNTLSEYFDIQPGSRAQIQAQGKKFLIVRPHDTQRHLVTFKTGPRIPKRFKEYEATVSIESRLRRMFPSGKAILYGSQLQAETHRLIESLVEINAKIRTELDRIHKPIIFLEGKSDRKIVEAAWHRLYPDEEIPFELVPIGSWINPDDAVGGASNLTHLLNLCTPLVPSEKICIALYDNDREGLKQLGKLKKEIYTEDKGTQTRKHKTKKIFAMLLPVPKDLQHSAIINAPREFSIEHYFSPNILSKYSDPATGIEPGRRLPSEFNKKKFSDEVKELDQKEFENMRILFNTLMQLTTPENE